MPLLVSETMKLVDGRRRDSARVLVVDLEEVHKVQCLLRNVDPFGGDYGGRLGVVQVK